MTPERLRHLDDPARPWRRVYAIGARFAKVYAMRQDRPFGEIGWTITGSLCGPDGHALSDATGVALVLGPRLAHEVIVLAEGDADPAACLEAGVATVVQRVAIAADNMERAP